MELSNRLKTIASFVTEGYCAADIGTDHGYIPIYLTQTGCCPKAFAMDINEEPLNRAKQHITETNTADKIVCILSDGLNQLPQKEVDSIIITGMGGDLVVRILEQDLDKLDSVKELILSPQSHLEKVRHFLHDHNFRILEEEMLCEDGKYYMIMRAVHGHEEYKKECFYLFGQNLILDKHPVLLEYLDLEYQKYEKICATLTDESKEHIKIRKKEVKTMLCNIREALGYYEM
ncbi:tRNA (adenine(22)-N(1))-methyltransferase [Anaerostipes faecalis]|uniref:tRNA (adenine(22)-N(1))-methyltransferase n=1 Tax=Anaerostipes faecalis TaxID=2738446 RepID=UPI001C1DE169|nr:class I SAM-dependent methyltransferase [Anaerostipes faecalis]